MKGGFFIKFYCSLCNNSDKNYFSKIGNKVYCRKCLNFVGKRANKEYEIKRGSYKLNYDLTVRQKEASDFILKNIKHVP